MSEDPVRSDVDVDIASIGSGPIRIATYHYSPPGPALGILQVLVHGGTYDHRYWDAPEQGGRSYSYARFMAARGYHVVAVDQLGTPHSSQPPGDAVTLGAASSALAQVIAQLRAAGGVGATGTVALVGHSIGTIVSVYTQAVHRPADVLVTTGLGHVPSGAGSPFGEGVLEAELANEYCSLPPEARARAFYDGGSAEPEVIAFDNESLRTVIARGLLLDALGASGDVELSRVGEVEGPVYVQLGANDLIGPAALAPQEAATWKSSDDVTVETLETIGHCFNLHPANKASWLGIDTWLRTRRSN